MVANETVIAVGTTSSSNFPGGSRRRINGLSDTFVTIFQPLQATLTAPAYSTTTTNTLSGLTTGESYSTEATPAVWVVVVSIVLPVVFLVGLLAGLLVWYKKICKFRLLARIKTRTTGDPIELDSRRQSPSSARNSGEVPTFLNPAPNSSNPDHKFNLSSSSDSLVPSHGSRRKETDIDKEDLEKAPLTVPPPPKLKPKSVSLMPITEARQLKDITIIKRLGGGKITTTTARR